MTRIASVALLIMLTASASATAQNQTTPVVSTLADSSPAVAPVLQIRSDGLGSYFNKPRYLDSLIDSIGDWELDLGMVPTKGSGRRAYLAFDQPVSTSGPNGTTPVAPPSQQYIVRFVSKCFTQANNLLQLTAGQQITCPIVIRFDDYNGNQFRIHMNRSDSAGTDDVLIACNGAGADGRCNRWTVRPSGFRVAGDGSVISANAGRLVKLVTKKGSTTEVLQGDFVFAFDVDLAK